MADLESRYYKADLDEFSSQTATSRRRSKANITMIGVSCMFLLAGVVSIRKPSTVSGYESTRVFTLIPSADVNFGRLGQPLASPIARTQFTVPRALPVSSIKLARGSALEGITTGPAAAVSRSVAAKARVARATAAEASNPIAIMDTTMGIIKAELFLDKTPITVSNFVDLASNGYFDGIHFHRVIPNFMDQFGCPFAKDPTDYRAGTGGPDGGTSFENLKTGELIMRDDGGNIPDENIDQTSNKPGTLSMANTGRPNSGGSQFFINVNDNSFLDWFNGQTPSKHPVFGQVIENFDLAVAISEVPTSNDRPKTPIKMNSIKIEFPK